VSEPQILDSAGNRLQVGDRVRYLDANIPFGEAIGAFTWDCGWRVQIRMRGEAGKPIAMPTEPARERNTFCCSVLTLIPTQEDD
jgi:hypothetical protein